AQGIDGSVDLSTLQVHRYDPGTGESQAVAARYEAVAVPDEWHSRVQRASLVEGRPRPTLRPRTARPFNRVMDAAEGEVIWSNEQAGDPLSHYAIYFDLLDAEQPYVISPAPWIGDADVLRR